MPKAAHAQTGFTSGEVSPLYYGNHDGNRYKKALAFCRNYIPTLQGPLIRRPGTKFIAMAKDPTSGGTVIPPIPPVMIPFNFSADQAYMMEVGNHYIRFFANGGQIVTSGASFQVVALSAPYIDYGAPSARNTYATRPDINPLPGETIISTTSITSGSILELRTPYVARDVAQLRYAQNQDTLYIVHPNYPVMKLQRQGNAYWTLVPVYFGDGPYLGLDSYLLPGDSTNISLVPLSVTLPVSEVQTGPSSTVTAMVTDPGGTGQIKVTVSAAHAFLDGQKVFINGVVGTTEANNFDQVTGLYNSHVAYWSIRVLSTTTFLLLGSVFTTAYVSGGTVYPALFWADAAAIQAGNFDAIPDKGRILSLTIGGLRFWGNLAAGASSVPIPGGFNNASRAYMWMGGTSPLNQTPFPGTTVTSVWNFGVWSGLLIAGPTFNGTGYPGTVCFHQNRLVFAGTARFPQQVDFSRSNEFERFSPSDPLTLTVRDNDAMQFNLNSEDANVLRWLASTSQGLLSGSFTSEWAMTPASTSEALTPTNFNAQQTSFFGAANVQCAKLGNAVLYIQRANRKLREMNFFFQVGTFRSIDMSELSEHITLPSIIQLAVQKETQPLIWVVRSDGVLLSMVYNRDDLSIAAGWAHHDLGGTSDLAGTIPIVNSIAFIPAVDLSYDQMWMVVKRTINTTDVWHIETMQRIPNDSIAQEDSFHVDAGGTYDVPITMSGVTAANPGVVVAIAHGLANGDKIKINSVLGMNKIVTDVNGNETTENAVNGKTFVVANKTTDTFELNDFSGNPYSTVGYTASTGGKVRKLVTTISGLTWLKNEPVSVLADGGIHPNAVVSSAGVLTLQYAAAVVQIGIPFVSQGKLMRVEAGASDGTSIGKTRRTTRASFMLHRIGDLSIGTEFTRLIPVQFSQADQNLADNAVPLFSGIHRDGVESAYDFDSQICFQQSAPLPGIIQSITSFMEEFDV